MNVTVVRGCLSRPPQIRQLPSNDRVANLEVTVPADRLAPAYSVPVMVAAPPDWLVALQPGAEVVVLGYVRRRFFRAGGATASRTEVVAERVVPAAQTKRVAALLQRATRLLDAW
jgi:single-strand DNA-binding protein